MRILSVVVHAISALANIFLLIAITFALLHFVGFPLIHIINQASLMQPFIILLCLILSILVQYTIYRIVILPFRKKLDK